MAAISAEIISVVPGSICDDAGIEPGDKLIKIGKDKMTDILTYRFYEREKKLKLTIEKKDGSTLLVRIRNEACEPLGLSFKDGLLDKPHACTNNCVFCFIDQMPRGMRKTLYFKDDDARLSFLTGNYITATNLSNADINRIIRQKISPLNLSIHSTDADVRRKMLRNNSAVDIKKVIKKLAKGGIRMNGQIVLCPGYNDGENLQKTLEDLFKYANALESVSVVPVGLTKHRERLTKLSGFTKESASVVIDAVTQFQNKAYKKLGHRFVYLGDEFYIKAERQIPDYESYDSFLQLENGVGMVAVFLDEINTACKSVEYTLTDKRTVNLVTGVAAYPYILYATQKLMEMHENLCCNVYKIENDFFGKDITVAGLITGTDIVNQLKDKNLSGELLMPSSMFRQDGSFTMLDDYTIEALEQKLGVEITVTDSLGCDFVEKVLGIHHTDKKE